MLWERLVPTNCMVYLFYVHKFDRKKKEVEAEGNNVQMNVMRQTATLTDWSVMCSELERKDPFVTDGFSQF